MNEITKRLNAIKKYYKLSGSGLASQLGGNTTSVNCYFSGKSNPSSEFLCKLLDAYPSISAEWLMRGKGNMLIGNATPADEEVAKELADAKITMLVKDGIIRELKEMILDKKKLVVEKYEDSFK